MTKTNKGKLNGGVDLLAKAMRQVFTEGVEKGVTPPRQYVADLKEDVSEVKKKVRRLDTDMQNGLNELKPAE